MTPPPPSGSAFEQCGTLYDPKMYPHTNFGIPSSKNIGDVPEVKVKVTPK